MEYESEIKKALEELRSEKQRKFDQTVDLIINLQKFNVKKTPINLLINVPHKVKDKKLAAFLDVKKSNIDTITTDQFKKYFDKNEIKKLVKKYDFFISQASLMPKVATVFGRVLGPAGKMPSPQLGVIAQSDEQLIEELKKKINNTVKLKVKEASVKLPIGKQSMRDEDLLENIGAVYNALLKAMPKEKDNIKNIEIKFTMTKPRKIKIR